MSSSGTEIGTLVELIRRLAADRSRLDEDFARTLAAGLQERADHISLPQVEALGLSDVVVTFSMDEEMRLVVTGNLRDSGGDVSVRWPQTAFDQVRVAIHQTPRQTPYLFATLDFSVRGQRAQLREAVSPLPAGLDVTLRCLSTVGQRVTYRVVAHGQEVSVSPSALTLSPKGI